MATGHQRCPPPAAPRHREADEARAEQPERDAQALGGLRHRRPGLAETGPEPVEVGAERVVGQGVVRRLLQPLPGHALAERDRAREQEADRPQHQQRDGEAAVRQEPALAHGRPAHAGAASMHGDRQAHAGAGAERVERPVHQRRHARRDEVLRELHRPREHRGQHAGQHAGAELAAAAAQRARVDQRAERHVADEVRPVVEAGVVVRPGRHDQRRERLASWPEPAGERVQARVEDEPGEHQRQGQRGALVRAAGRGRRRRHAGNARRGAGRPGHRVEPPPRVRTA